MTEDKYSPPFTVQLINNFIDRDTLSYLFNICETANFFDGIQIGPNGEKIVKPSVKIRYDYVLTRAQCSLIDYNLISKTKLTDMKYRENWRIFYYDGEGDSKAFRGRHTDWYKDQYEQRRISMIVGLSESRDYEGGELWFEELNLSLKLNRNTCVLFDSRMFHEVRPVTKGKRFVLQTFLFDEGGWNLIKDSRVRSRYALIPPPAPINQIKTIPEWEILEGVCLINPKSVAYHNEYIGKYNDYKEVLQVFNSVRNDIYAFTWFKPEYEDFNLRGRVIGWSLGKFTGPLGKNGPYTVSNKDHVISGKVKDIVKYLHSGKHLTVREDNLNSNKIVQELSNENYIIPITTDSGPGNQVITIKEAMLMAKFSGRKVAAPPIIQHYIADRKRGRRGEYKAWNFSHIFSCDSLVDLSEFHLEECYTNFRVSIMPESVKCTSKFDPKIVKNKETVVINKKFQQESDYDFLKSNNDRAVMISGLFNRTKFSNCCTNGCDTCDMYPLFLEDYKFICKQLDFSKLIKDYGDEFINTNNMQNGYLALHIRLDDLGRETYDVEKICNLLRSDSELKDLPIFVATNCAKNIKADNIIMFKEDPRYDELESFIEQYICTRSQRFYYNGGGLSRKDTGHLRSTWSSFVVDYRKYKMENMENHYLKDFIGSA